MDDLGTGRQEVLERRVCVLAMLIVLERCQRRVHLRGVPGGQVIVVLGHETSDDVGRRHFLLGRRAPPYLGRLKAL